MLTIGKLAQGQERYYLDAVAGGAEEYYVSSGEAPGRWLGGGSRDLALTGEVAGQAFTRLLQAQDPTTGHLLGRPPGSVAGFDLTFSAPKSVSLLFALGDDGMASRMVEAHQVAMKEALAYLEETASHGRRGHAGAQRVRTNGFVAAAFRHRTSRAGDPNLHTHVVVPNRVLGVDGKWTALDARALYQQARTAGHLYQAQLRHELRDLGFTWTVGRNGLGEIDQVPTAVRREFSRRRIEIEGAMADLGLTSAASAQAANLATRKVKGRDVRTASATLTDWQARAQALGFDATAVPREPQRTRPLRLDHDELVGARGLTASASTFGEREVLRAVANALPDGAPMAELRRLAAKVLASSSVVALDQLVPRRSQDVLRSEGRLLPLGSSEQRYTTRELLALERSLVVGALAVQDSGASVADPAAVEHALTDAGHLSGEQRRMVRRLALDPHGVQLVMAPAGSGKTSALAAVVAAYQDSGVRIVGTTLSAKAAGVLRNSAGLPTFTVTRFLADLRAVDGTLPPGAVVVIDEASQVGTRPLAEIFGAVRRAGGKLVLVGDPHQLPEIDAGGAYRGLLARLEPVELTANYRQRDAADRARLSELRRGNVAAAMADYDRSGLVARAPDGERLRTALVADWLAAFRNAVSDADRGDVVMLALTNRDIGELNSRARALLADDGLVAGPALVVDDVRYQAGDHVVTRRNDRRVGVLNGQRWSVREVRAEGLLLTPVGREAAEVVLPLRYLERPGWLQHGYAVTVAVAQGSSVERAFVLGSEATYREAGYTAASRARAETRWYVVGHEPLETDDLPHQQGLDPLSALTEALSRSAVQDLALDTWSPAEPSYLT